MTTLTEKICKIEFEDHNGNVLEASFTRQTQFEEDSDYGADADGRRGTAVSFIQSDRAVDLMVRIGTQWYCVLEFPDNLRITTEEAVQNWIEENDPESE